MIQNNKTHQEGQQERKQDPRVRSQGGNHTLTITRPPGNGVSGHLGRGDGVHIVVLPSFPIYNCTKAYGLTMRQFQEGYQDAYSA